MSVGEIKYLITHEDVVHLDDLILRRTMIGKLGMITPESLRELSEICANSLNWSQKKTETEIERFTDIMRNNHKMDFKAFLGG
jgi:glycerol-3-phosphate dehydrogenase